MKSSPRVGFVAPSSVVPPYEFELGLERLSKLGVSFSVHPQCRKKHLFFAGNDEERAQAFFESAQNPSLDILWCARGGYGAYRLLPILDRMTEKSGIPPRKLLVGYSDSTVLLDYVRERWGWCTLHGPTPGLASFTEIKKTEIQHLLSWMNREMPRKPFGKNLRFLGPKPTQAIEGTLTGGNLATLQGLIGTPYQVKGPNRLLFLEEVSETLSRLDRVLHHFMQAGAFEGVQAILLGDFKDCKDIVRSALLKPQKKLQKKNRKPRSGPSRAVVSLPKYFEEVFGSISECYKIPIAFGLPVGHGPGKESLPMGARYRLNPSGELEILHWDWISNPGV